MKKLIATAAAAALLPFAAAGQGLMGADNLSYTYVDVRYANQNVSGVSNPDGVLAEVSGQFADMFFVRGSYGRLSTSGAKLEQFIGEVGVRFELMPNLDLTGTAGVIHADIDVDDDTGFLITGGVRALLLPQLELEGRLIYVDVLDDDDFDGLINAQFHLTRQWSLGASYQFDAEVFTVGGRFNFGLF